MQSSSSEIAKAKLNPGTNELIKAALDDLETSEGRVSVKEALHKGYSGTKPAELVQRSLANLREVSAILDAKAPGDAQAFKTWLRGISEKVAEAASEGGFLGIGGVQVNDAEKATLADINPRLSASALRPTLNSEGGPLYIRSASHIARQSKNVDPCSCQR